MRPPRPPRGGSSLRGPSVSELPRARGAQATVAAPGDRRGRCPELGAAANLFTFTCGLIGRKDSCLGRRLTGAACAAEERESVVLEGASPTLEPLATVHRVR